MTILRRVHTKNFTVIGNDVMTDESLSAEALGVICYLISRPHDWVVVPGHLSGRFNCGRDRIQRVIKELIDASYIRKVRLRDPRTKTFLPVEYIILDTKTEPLPENTAMASSDDEPTGGEPATGNLPLLNTEEQKTDPNKSLMKAKKVKFGDYTDEFLTDIWEPYPRKRNTSKINAFKKWQALPPILQAQLKAAIPAFAISKRGTEEQFIPHLEFFISRRIFETVAPIGGGEPNAEMDRNSWEIASRIYANSSNWHRQWGPEPGHPRCLMPPDLQQQFVTGH